MNNKKEIAKNALSELIDKYNDFIATANKKDFSEETVRTWINSLLAIFGWDVRNTADVLQERVLSTVQKEKLIIIDSAHTRPDYTLINGQSIKAFIDAKDLKVDIFNDKATAFQVRSYGWSANTPCSFATNFEQLVIFDCRFMPLSTQSVDNGSIKLHITNYLDNFELIFDHLFKDNIKSNKLEEIYSLTSIEGSNKLDEKFNIMLTDFRLKLANSLLQNNSVFNNNEQFLNYYAQVILDRIIFIRVCESRGIEESEKLKAFKAADFWNSFKSSCYLEFYKHYDGAMFSKDEVFENIVLPNDVFEKFINSLYYPFPYKFDVIPVKVIAQIYEDFLSKQLVVENGLVNEKLKSEYIKEKGAITTPQYIVDTICKNTIELKDVNDIESLLNIKILDPACGSGVFLISCFEIICKKAIDLYTSGNVSKEFSNWFINDNEIIYLSVSARREIIKCCLFGIDIDEAATEVTKMSLALKIIDNNSLLVLTDIGLFGDKILREIHSNICLGNTLVDVDNSIDPVLINSIKPINVSRCFKDVFESKSGFDYIVGNPPYVETKHYKLASPEMHEYLKDKYMAFEGKADLSVIFIERCLKLLNSDGKLGFIVQKRFFKTNYGENIRKIISEAKSISKIIDFKTDKIFHKRITYVAILILTKKEISSMSYQLIPFEPLQIKTFFENEELDNTIAPIEIDSSFITKDIWAFESFELLELIDELTKKHGVLSEFEGLSIKDGIQALWKKAYHITNYSIVDEYLVGINGFNEKVKLEIDMVRPVIYNKFFYCFKKLIPHAYSLFPYRKDGKTPIKISEIKLEFPEAYKYLLSIENRVKNSVQYYDDCELWHRFTREHNHEAFLEDKIILPMTAKDSIATCSLNTGLYMDNANVWFIKIKNCETILLKAVCSVINSTIFSVLAKAKANPQSGGYYKLNKQFLTPVPFPSAQLLKQSNTIEKLSLLSDEIETLQENYLKSTPANKEVVKGVLLEKWGELDAICYTLYGLEKDQITLVANEGRTVSRIELLNGAE